MDRSSQRLHQDLEESRPLTRWSVDRSTRRGLNRDVDADLGPTAAGHRGVITERYSFSIHSSTRSVPGDPARKEAPLRLTALRLVLVKRGYISGVVRRRTCFGCQGRGRSNLSLIEQDRT